MAKYLACICEGGAEHAILDLLLDNHSLVFEREDLIEEEVLKCRRGRDFEEKYLKKGFSEKITVYQILDSRNENFKLRKAYEKKVDVINVVTAPEIEMLIICNEDRYKDFKNSGEKPSTYCKRALKYSKVKSYDFIYEYFSDINILINALHEYRRISKIRRKEMTLWDLLKQK